MKISAAILSTRNFKLMKQIMYKDNPKEIDKNKTIAVVGQGYVGLPLALLADRKGYRVFGIDNNKEKVEKINKRILPYEDKDLETQLKNSSLTSTLDWKVIKEA